MGGWVLDSKKFGCCLVESSLKKSTSVARHVEGLRERERLRADSQSKRSDWRTRVKSVTVTMEKPEFRDLCSEIHWIG